MAGDINGKIETTSSLALTLCKGGHHKEALQIAEDSVKLAEQINPPAFSHAFALRLQANVKVLCGNIRGAIVDAEKAMEIYKALGVTYQVEKMKNLINNLQAQLQNQTVARGKKTNY